MMVKVLVLANDESTIYNFRREILEAFVKEGFRVTVCYPLGAHSREIRQTGCELINMEVNRHGKKVSEDIKLLNAYRQIMKTYDPDIVLTYTVKPNVYGSISCQMTHKPYINNVTGLGSILQRSGMLSGLVLILQKLAYRKSSCIFFQNQDDCKKMREYRCVSDRTPTGILPGSGVNLSQQAYEPFPENDGVTRFIMVSRIRRDKGYQEFFEAADRIKREYPSTEFHVVGWYEEDTLKLKVDELKNRDVIIYHGKRTQEEVHGLIKSCSCLVHPSYHEGMANVLLEAAATGRPVIASKIPGCREAFEEGVTGYGCESKNADSLFQAMERMVLTPYENQVEMGRAGRRKMEKEFDRNFVAKVYLEKIKEITGGR